MAFLLTPHIYINWKEHKPLSLLRILSPGLIQANPGEVLPHSPHLPYFLDRGSLLLQGLAYDKILPISK